MNDGHHRRLYDTLAGYFGYMEFRPLQREIIEDVIRGKDTFVLMPTGGGKSLCYQLPALLMDGLTVVVSPLIALMKDQVDALVASGVAATYINSSLSQDEVNRRLSRVRSGAIKLLYCAPERLTMPFFLSLLSSLDVSLFAIDEAHCISEWGHDFREDYRKLRIIREKFSSVPIMALTATATPRVAADIISQLHLKQDTACYKASFNRPNLTYMVRRKTDAFVDLMDFLQPRKGESGIVYCLSRKSTEAVAEKLRSKGFKALAYHAGLDNIQRAKHQEQFIRDEVDIVCATIAFGMGIDKSNVRFVVHYDIPKNLEGYYQETGRAGRDGLPSDCLLLYAPSDKMRMLRLFDTEDETLLRHYRENLDRICAFAEARTCRKKIVLEYFGETLEEENCGKCDICLGTHKIERSDFTVAAQKFLSTIIRTSQKFGVKYIIDILRGDDDERILHNRHHELTTFGIGKELRVKEWQHIAHELMQEGYVFRDEANYGVLKLTTKGSEALIKRYDIMLASLPRRRSADDRSEERLNVAIPDFPEANKKLFDVLRILRKQIADERDLPPYVIFHDTVLRQMAASLPFTKYDILRLSGVGEKKADDFGPVFAKTIYRFVQDNPEIKPLTITANPQSQRYAKSSETVIATIKLFQKGISPYEIAKERGLSPSVISNHLEEGIRNGDITDITRLVPDRHIENIRQAFRSTGSSFLKPVLAHLNDVTITYDHLKFVRAFDQRAQ